MRLCSLQLGRILLLFLLFLSFCCLIPFAFTATAHVHAASGAIQITTQTDSVAFPKSIDFHMTAVDSSSNIVQAVLYVASDDSIRSVPNTSYMVNFHPARTISIAYHDSITDSNFVTPGTPMQYYWILQDSSGNSYTGSTQYFMLLDSRFSWQHRTSGQVTVNWYNRPQDFGQTLLNDATSDVDHIGSVLGGGLLHPINLWVYQTADDFHGALPPGSYEWVGGIAFPSLNEAFISAAGSFDTTLIRDMPHELTHLVFHQLIAQGAPAPVWFDEGLAVYNQQYHEPEMTARLNEALSSHTLLRLRDISFNFPADANQAYLAYAQSWNLVSYMYNTFGQPEMAHLIALMNNPNSDFSDNLAKALGEDTLHLESQWRLSLHQSSVLAPGDQPPVKSQTLTVPPDQLPGTANTTEPLFVSVGVLLIVVPFFCIIFLVINERRKRQKMQVALEAQHILDVAFAQPPPSRNPSITPRPLWSDGTRASYPSPFPLSPSKPAVDEQFNRYPEYPSYKEFKEYPQQGQQQQAPQE